ncbi:MAG: rod shape-determining protein MreC [Clostridia bacterium]
MLEFIKRWKFLGLILLLILLLLLARSCGNSETASKVEGAAQESKVPVAAVGDFFGNIFDFSTKKSLQAEIDDLNQQLAELKTDSQISSDVESENEKLRELLDLKNSYQTGWETVAAEVIGREADNWYEKLTINKGSKDGITENMAVVDQNGLVGKIVNVTEKTSEVQMMIDSGASLGGMLQKSSIEGVLQGIGGGKGLVTMTKLPYNADIQLNDVVVTSGVGGVFPAGLLVGTVVKVNTSSDGLSKEAIIEPYCDFDDIQFVLVIRQLSEEELAAQQKKDGDTDDEGSADSGGSSSGSDSDTGSGEDDTE